MRTVKTTSGATAVQVVWSSRRGSREIEHLGSAHDEGELEALKAAAQQRIAAGQLELRRPRRQPVDRSTNRLVNQEIRQDSPPLPRVHRGAE
jgi:hypothetical protein